MKQKHLKVLGATLAVIAVLVFAGLTFYGNADLTETSLERTVESKHQPLIDRLKALPEAPPAEMAGRVDEEITTYNTGIIAQKGISDDYLDKVLSNINEDPAEYNEAFIAEYFAADPEVEKRVIENTGWMIDREWESFDEFNTQFRQKMDEINRGILEDHGIGEQRREQFRQEVMENGAPGWLKDGLWAWLIFGTATLGGLLYMIPGVRKQPGIKNDGIYHRKMQNRKWPAIILFGFLVAFYIVLYQFPQYFVNQIVLLEPLSQKMAGVASGRWFMYGFLYTLVMLIFGAKMMVKYRGNAYQQLRTAVVVFFQVVFAFTLPQILTLLQKPSYDIKSIWPLEYSFFFDYRVEQMLEAGTFGLFLLFWGSALVLIAVPLLTYIYGKRWYCSWVCGCGGLAETAGDPFRHLSDKSLGAWKIERWMVHGVLVLAVLMTAGTLYTTFTGESQVLGVNSYDVRASYGFFIGFIFAGAVGTGFYPVMGNRVWCRFGCPLAAYIGLVQRFKSRFRITTNGGQCISCGNCSTYCEMGIDVRWYAQRGQNIVRASCVGCGICSAVCPRGVLKLENRDEKGRVNDNPILIGREGVSLNL